MCIVRLNVFLFFFYLKTNLFLNPYFIDLVAIR